MGATGSKEGNAAASAAAQMSAAEVVTAIEETARNLTSNAENQNVHTNLQVWEGIFKGIEKKRYIPATDVIPNGDTQGPDAHVAGQGFDKELILEGILTHVKRGFHSSNLQWKLSSVEKATTFFQYPAARKRLKNMDFVGAVMLLTMPPLVPDDDASDVGSKMDDGASIGGAGGGEDELARLQIFAARVFCTMAEYPDFEPLLTSTAVLNFLCIVLNQLEEAEEVVTRVFMKLARNPSNLIALVEGSVGDILESYFSLSFAQLEKETDRDTAEAQVVSFANCTNTLGQLIKYGFQCQLEYPVLTQVIEAASDAEAYRNNNDDDGKRPATNVYLWVSESLLAEMVRLLYWLCRTSEEGLVPMLASASVQEDCAHTVEILCTYWRTCCLTAYDSFVKQSSVSGVCDLEKLNRIREVVCNMNVLLWVMMSDRECRYLFKKYKLKKLDLIFDLLYLEPPPSMVIQVEEVEQPISPGGGNVAPSSAISAGIGGKKENTQLSRTVAPASLQSQKASGMINPHLANRKTGDGEAHSGMMKPTAHSVTHGSMIPSTDIPNRNLKSMAPWGGAQGAEPSAEYQKKSSAGHGDPSGSPTKGTKAEIGAGSSSDHQRRTSASPKHGHHHHSGPKVTIKDVVIQDRLAIFNTALSDRTLMTAKYILDSSTCSESLAIRLGERCLQMLFYLIDTHIQCCGDGQEDDYADGNGGDYGGGQASRPSGFGGQSEFSKMSSMRSSISSSSGKPPLRMKANHRMSTRKTAYSTASSSAKKFGANKYRSGVDLDGGDDDYANPMLPHAGGGLKSSAMNINSQMDAAELREESVMGYNPGPNIVSADTLAQIVAANKKAIRDNALETLGTAAVAYPSPPNQKLIQQVAESTRSQGSQGREVEDYAILPLGVIVNLLESVSLACMRRDCCASFASQDLFQKLYHLLDILESPEYAHVKKGRIHLGIIRLSTLLAIHPSHRLPWSITIFNLGGAGNLHPPRDELLNMIDEITLIKRVNARNLEGVEGYTPDPYDPIVESLCQMLKSTILKQDSLFGKFNREVWDVVFGLIGWWRESSSMRVAEEKEIADKVKATADMLGEDIHKTKNALTNLLDSQKGIESFNHGLVLAEFHHNRDKQGVYVNRIVDAAVVGGSGEGGPGQGGGPGRSGGKTPSTSKSGVGGVRTGTMNLAASKDPVKNKSILEKIKAITNYSCVNPYIDKRMNDYPAIQEGLKYTSIYESLLILQMFSRLCLEPKWKKLLFGRRNINVPRGIHGDGILKLLLACVATSIWPEAREACACLANLCYSGDKRCEKLLCWLKFDSPTSIAVDAANVLMPIPVGHLKAIDLGKGMYRRSWGQEFLDLSLILLHPDGLNVSKIPGALTTASPSDTFQNSNAQYKSLLETDKQAGKHFSVHLWFLWPIIPRNNDKSKHVLLQSHPNTHETIVSIVLSKDKSGGIPSDSPRKDFQSSPSKGDLSGMVDGVEATLHLLDQNDEEFEISMPKLQNGWHRLAIIVSSADAFGGAFNGTRVFVDEWCNRLDSVFLKSNFHVLGNDIGGKMPFGAIADFRIYGRVLRDQELEVLLKPPVFGIQTQQHGLDTDDGNPASDITSSSDNYFPDQIIRRIVHLGAAKVLASRLDIPDSAAEALRCLGSLATLQEARSQIFGLCAPKILELSESPCPMIKRQTARILSNLN